MDSMLPIISVTDLQRSTKAVLKELQDYAVVQNHGRDVALLLHPDIGRALLQSDAFRELLCQCRADSDDGPVDFHELDGLIGQVLRELSKK
jgi:hypothetical protein|tara:strand:- start:811 stop:1083 length:273 start_codon:yes stop_codon:yes gene_type:complete